MHAGSPRSRAPSIKVPGGQEKGGHSGFVGIVWSPISSRKKGCKEGPQFLEEGTLVGLRV